MQNYITNVTKSIEWKESILVNVPHHQHFHFARDWHLFSNLGSRHAIGPHLYSKIFHISKCKGVNKYLYNNWTLSFEPNLQSQWHSVAVLVAFTQVPLPADHIGNYHIRIFIFHWRWHLQVPGSHIWTKSQIVSLQPRMTRNRKQNKRVGLGDWQ